MVTGCITGVDVKSPLMKVIITFTFWKSKFVALVKPGKLREFFFLSLSFFVVTLLGLAKRSR